MAFFPTEFPPTLLMSVNILDTWLLEGGVIFPQLQEEMNAVNIQLLVSPEQMPPHCTSDLQQCLTHAVSY